MTEAQISQIAANQVSQTSVAESTDATANISPANGSVVQNDSINQFQAALESPINSSQATNMSGDVRYGFNPDATQDPYSTGAYGTSGNMAMDAMQNVRDKFEGIKSEIQAISDKKDFTQVDLLHLQMSIIQLSYIADLSSKTADKMSQAAQTLFRNQ